MKVGDIIAYSYDDKIVSRFRQILSIKEDVVTLKYSCTSGNTKISISKILISDQKIMNGKIPGYSYQFNQKDQREYLEGFRQECLSALGVGSKGIEDLGVGSYFIMTTPNLSLIGDSGYYTFVRQIISIDSNRVTYKLPSGLILTANINNPHFKVGNSSVLRNWFHSEKDTHRRLFPNANKKEEMVTTDKDTYEYPKPKDFELLIGEDKWVFRNLDKYWHCGRFNSTHNPIKLFELLDITEKDIARCYGYVPKAGAFPVSKLQDWEALTHAKNLIIKKAHEYNKKQSKSNDEVEGIPSYSNMKEQLETLSKEISPKKSLVLRKFKRIKP